MKNTFIKYKIDKIEILSPVSSCTFYSDCVVIVESTDEDYTLIIPNGEWEYVEKEILIPNYTYDQYLFYDHYRDQYYSELVKIRRE